MSFRQGYARKETKPLLCEESRDLDCVRHQLGGKHFNGEIGFRMQCLLWTQLCTLVPVPQQMNFRVIILWRRRCEITGSSGAQVYFESDAISTGPIDANGIFSSYSSGRSSAFVSLSVLSAEAWRSKHGCTDVGKGVYFRNLSLRTF